MRVCIQRLGGLVLPRAEHPRASEPAARLWGREAQTAALDVSKALLVVSRIRRGMQIGVRAVGVSDGVTGHKHAGTELEGGL